MQARIEVQAITELTLTDGRCISLAWTSNDEGEDDATAELYLDQQHVGSLEDWGTEVPTTEPQYTATWYVPLAASGERVRPRQFYMLQTDDLLEAVAFGGGGPDGWTRKDAFTCAYLSAAETRARARVAAVLAASRY